VSYPEEVTHEDYQHGVVEVALWDNDNDVAEGENGMVQYVVVVEMVMVCILLQEEVDDDDIEHL
jgi:hypothetical protein